MTDLSEQLAALGEEKEALALVFRELKGWSMTDFVLHLREELTPEDAALLDSVFQRLSQHQPAQYILGKSYFQELELKVDERVLIPRPETEELVQLILTENPKERLRVLDIGTGSGAIALALKQARPDWQVIASDISLEALSLARENAERHQLDVTFVHSDVFSALEGRFDIIVSNPPYISYEDKEEVGDNVLAFEPHLALFAAEDGYAIYRKILTTAPAFLASDGKLYFEIGHRQGLGIQKLTKDSLPDKEVRVLQDQFGKDRMVVIHETDTLTKPS